MAGLYLFPCETDATRPVPCRIYDFRHTWATRAVQAGIDLVILAAMLGHSKINMVMRYAHPTQDHQSNVMNKMEQYVIEQKLIQARAAKEKAEGIAFPSPDLSAMATRHSARRLTVAKRTADPLTVIEGLRNEGVLTFWGLARKLNERGITAPRGGLWTAAQIARLRSEGTQGA